MTKGKIIIISGPSGSGKTTLYQKVLKSQKFKGRVVKSISATTRQKRKGEKDGKDYFFISKKMFLYKIKAGHFLEYEKVFDNYYGTPRRNVDRLLKKGKNVLLSIDVKGAKTVSRKFKDTIRVFVKAPSMAVLKQRLVRRGSESREELGKRLRRVKKELKEAERYDHIIVNDYISSSYKKIEKILIENLPINTRFGKN